LIIEITDELDFMTLAGFVLERQVFVSDKMLLLDLPKGRSAGFFILEQPDFPKFLADQLLAGIAQEFGHERIGVGDFARRRIENQNSVARRLKKTAVTNLRGPDGGL